MTQPKVKKYKVRCTDSSGNTKDSCFYYETLEDFLSFVKDRCELIPETEVLLGKDERMVL